MLLGHIKGAVNVSFGSSFCTLICHSVTTLRFLRTHVMEIRLKY